MKSWAGYCSGAKKEPFCSRRSMSAERTRGWHYHQVTSANDFLPSSVTLCSFAADLVPSWKWWNGDIKYTSKHVLEINLVFQLCCVSSVLVCIREGLIYTGRKIIEQVRDVKPAEQIEDHPRERILYFKERYFSAYIATRWDECGRCVEQEIVWQTWKAEVCRSHELCSRVSHSFGKWIQKLWTAWYKSGRLRSVTLWAIWSRRE